MPRINKIRVTNINYDHNKKQMPDLSLKVDSLDSIFLLANGGGKSLLIQLILQTILPNTPVGKRKVADLFESGDYTGHIAVEWLLDNQGEDKKYLCTGFCFTEGSNNRSLDYYNYLFDYEGESDFSIDTLPLIKREDLLNREHPIGFQELRDWIREHKEKKIQIFNRNYEYQNYLKRYRILPEEWKNIRDTNGSEGGVDQFFAKSKTTEQLVDNLLIPTVEKMLFQNQDRKEELFNAFSEYRNKLLRMPKIEANIKDFKVISTDAENLVTEVRKAESLAHSLEDENIKLVNLAKTFNYHIEDATAEIESLEQSKKEFEIKENELLWKKKSYQVFKQKLKHQNLLEAKKEQENSYAKSKEEMEKKRRKEAQVEGLYYFNQAGKLKEELDNYRYQLEMLDRSEPELKEKLKELKTKLSLAWQEKNELLIKENKTSKDKLSSLEDGIKTISQEIKRKELEANNYQEQRADLKAWFSNYKEAKERLEGTLEDSLLEPTKLLKDKEDLLSSAQQQEVKLKRDLEELRKREEELTEERIALHSKENNLVNNLEKTEEKLSLFSKTEDQLLGLLAKEGKIVDGVLEKKEELIFYSRDLLDEIREKRVNGQAELASLEEKWALFDGRDYYISDHELLKVKNILEDKGLYTVLGSEWLASQDLSSTEKESYLNHQPLLPYSILIEDGQINQVKNILSYSNELSADIPLLFMLKNSENLKMEDSREKLVALQNDNLFLYRSQESELFVSKMAFEEFKANLSQNIAEKKEELKEAKEREELVARLKERIDSFYRHYSLEEISELREDKKRFKEKLETLKEELEKIKNERLSLKDKVQDREEKLRELKESVVKLEQIITKLNDFISLYSLKESKEDKLEGIELEIAKIKDRLLRLRNNKDDYQEDKLELRQKLQESNMAIEEHKKEYQKYELEDITPDFKLEKSYGELKSEVEGIEERLSQKQGDRDNLKALVEKCNLSYQEKWEEIKKLELKKEWLEENKRYITKEELEEAQLSLAKTKKELKDEEKLLNQKENQVRTAKEVLEVRSEGILEEFNQEPYFDFSEDSKLQFERIKESLEELKSKLISLEKRLKERANWKKSNQDVLDSLKHRLDDVLREYWAQGERLSKEEWEGYDLQPKSIFRKWEERRNQVKEELEQEKREVDIQFRDYLHQLKATKNPKVRQFTRKVKRIMDNGRIYDYDYVETQFLRILEGLERYRRNYELQLEENKKNMEHLTNLCFRRAITIYNSLIEIQKNSKVELYGRRVQVIKMDWDSLEEEEGKEEIYNYLEGILDNLQALKEDGVDDDEIDKRMEERLKSRNLINVIAPIEDCRVRVYKPRKRSIVEESGFDYSDWSEVARWSGGEEYSVYITMFMIMISHIRKQVEGRSNAWKAILADNPFGKASSPHILETVFQIARSNQIQLICFTAHKQDSILKEFPVVYSLQLRNAYGKEVMQVEEMETGFYNLGVR